MGAAPAMASMPSCFKLMIMLAFQLSWFTRGVYIKSEEDRLPLRSIGNLTGFSYVSKRLTSAAAANVTPRLSMDWRSLSESAPIYEAAVYKGQRGQYVTRLYIGTPAVSFTAIVDTGSDLVWRQCKPCSRCYPQSDGGASIFDAARSATYETATCRELLCQAIGGQCRPADVKSCRYVYPYDHGAYTAGQLSYDMLSIRRLGRLPEPRRAPRVRLAFGCSGDSRAPLNFTGAGGILGLGGGPLSLPSQLGVGAFSYCLPARRLVGTPLVLGSAAATLAAALPAHVRARMQSAPFRARRGETLRYVGLRISVGGRRLPGPTRVAVLDTGSTFTHLPARPYAALLQAFRSRIPLSPARSVSLATGRLDLCYHKREMITLINRNSSLSTIPSLTFHLGPARLRLPTANYIVPIQGLLCLAISPSQGSDSDLPIIGNIQQQNFFFLYDLKSRLLSFAATDCANTSL